MHSGSGWGGGGGAAKDVGTPTSVSSALNGHHAGEVLSAGGAANGVKAAGMIDEYAESFPTSPHGHGMHHSQMAMTARVIPAQAQPAWGGAGLPEERE